MSQKEKFYWWLQMTGWVLFFSFNLFFSATFNFLNRNTLIIISINTVLLFSYTHWLRFTIKRYGWKSSKIGPLMIRLMMLNVSAALFVQMVVATFMVVVLQMFEWPEFSFMQLFGYSLNTLIVLSGWCLFYFLIHFFRNYKREEIEKWKLQSALNEAELNALKAQINPHFIFNCLNNIRAMILEDDQKARQMLVDLSELLRYSFQFSEAKFVKLGVELKIVRQYLELEKIQFGERLKFKVDLPQKLEEQEVPSFSILTLVENSIKHGLSNLRDGGHIEVVVVESDGQMAIKVSNSGQLVDNNNPGTGLQNLRGRLEMLYNSSASFDLDQDGEEVVAHLIIPQKNRK